ncbi:MAG: hypothetical protein K8J31_23065 [Anaerolineae bacterium]|nr:hypothetical protein [Anaerolineae bacterium]
MAWIRRLPLFWLLLGVLSLLGTGLILTLTRQGIATWSDSGQYFTAARTLLAGDGLRTCSGGYLTLWPPLFPILIAALQAVGLTNLEAARVINAVAFGLIIFAAGALYRRSLKLPVLALLGAGAVLLSWPQVLWAIHALSETVFTLLLVVFVWLLRRFRFAAILAVGRSQPAGQRNGHRVALALDPRYAFQ